MIVLPQACLPDPLHDKLGYFCLVLVAGKSAPGHRKHKAAWKCSSISRKCRASLKTFFGLQRIAGGTLFLTARGARKNRRCGWMHFPALRCTKLHVSGIFGVLQYQALQSTDRDVRGDVSQACARGVWGKGQGAVWRNSRTIHEASRPRDTAPVLPPQNQKQPAAAGLSNKQTVLQQ